VPEVKYSTGPLCYVRVLIKQKQAWIKSNYAAKF
jgi:hypothetical protein